MTSPLDQDYEITPGVLFQEVNGELVLLDLEGESYFGLNRVGRRIWQLLEERRPTSQIFEQLHSEYAVERAQLETELAELLGQLLAAGLVRPIVPAAEPTSSR
jgi:hypothetical protein